MKKAIVAYEPEVEMLDVAETLSTLKEHDIFTDEEHKRIIAECVYVNAKDNNYVVYHCKRASFYLIIVFSEYVNSKEHEAIIVCTQDSLQLAVAEVDRVHRIDSFDEAEFERYDYDEQ